MIGLADCNNFFVSCERALNPSLEGRAVVVLSNNDGCAVARSNEAKRLGVKMGQPAFQLRTLIESGQLIALSGNHLLYREISLRIHEILRHFAPSAIDYSVDEAFLDMSGIPDSALPDIGAEIVRECREKEGIPVTVGFAGTKTLCKIATETGKKRDTRVVVLSDQQEIDRILSVMPIGDLWGIGRRLTKRLYSLGVFTIGDFASRPLMWVRSRLGVNGEKSWREIHGENCIELDFKKRKLQDSISESRTFPIDIDDFDYIRARVAIYCAHVSKRLRIQGGECGKVTVFLRSNRFHTENGYEAPDGSIDFEKRVSDEPTITNAAITILTHIFRPGAFYKRAGVILSDITPARCNEPGLFEDKRQTENREKTGRLMKVIDTLNPRVGGHVVKLASQLTIGHLGHNDGYSSSFGAPLADGDSSF